MEKEYSKILESKALIRFEDCDPFGHLNNGRYIGPGHMDPFEETPVELIEQMMLCNVIAPLQLIKLCLPAMKRQGRGIGRAPMWRSKSESGPHSRARAPTSLRTLALCQGHVNVLRQ